MATIGAVIPALSSSGPALPATDDYSGIKFLRLSTTTRLRTAWTPGLVLRRILERERAGLPLDAGTVYREDANLVTAARRRFDSWESALKAAGVGRARRRISPRAVANTRESIIARLQEHAAAGLPASSCHQRLKKYGSAVHRLFGTWAAAREAAGVKAAKRVRHTRESFIALLREHAAADLPVSSSHPILQNYADVARRLFGSWVAAREAAGVKPTEVAAKRGLYTREYIIARLREHAAAGLSTSSEHPFMKKYGNAVRHLFGSWATAREAAGVKPTGRAAMRGLYTREYIISLLRKNAAAGLSTSSCHPVLRKCGDAVWRLFGSWAAARKAAGVKPIQLSANRVRHTRESVIALLRECAARGEPVTCGALEIRKRFLAIRRLFGTLAAAREAAGLPPGRIRRCRASNSEREN